MGSDSTLGIRKMSLRRAIWRARMTAKAMHDSAALSGPERMATDMLRASVKQQLIDAQADGGGDQHVLMVESDWHARVLERDPQVVCARSAADVAEVLDSEDEVDVLVTREAQLTLDHLRRLCPPAKIRRHIFVES